jgi:hypothetical protein
LTHAWRNAAASPFSARVVPSRVGRKNVAHCAIGAALAPPKQTRLYERARTYSFGGRAYNCDTLTIQEKNMVKKLLLAALIAGSFGSVTVPASAEVVFVREAPPALRAERVPAARRGYVWAPGHWEWKRHRHVWVKGHWVRERRGYVYNAPTWEERDGRWVMQQGNWSRRDRDGDGVRNRDDARPDNPNRQ